jgi:hypothetical protein
VTGADTSHAYDEHVKKVRDIASRLAGQRKLPIAHRHMLDTAALLHDITRNTDTTDTHHETGAVEASKLLQEWKLPADKVQAIAAMIRQHRASVPVGPDIPEYAKILRDADRLSSAGGALARSYKYQLGHGATNEDAALMSAVAHMMHKYHPTTGYGANALHFPESKDIYRAEYDDVVKAYEADVDKGNMPGPALRALAGIGKQAAETIPIQCGQEKLKLRMVDGTAVRNKHFTDFTMAGHGHVYSFIPKDEIWLEANLSAEDASHALNHELRERELMRTHGLKYDQAHQLVTNMERHERGGQADDKHAYTNNAK